MEAETADEKTDQMNDLNLQAKEKDKSSQQPSPQTFKGRNATKLPNSPLRRLQYREMGGLTRHHQRALSNSIYQKLPGRLGVKLCNLVDDTDGHVFLGFTKNGQFLLSYTQELGEDECIVFRLQWWFFLRNKKLKKVSEVRLFGDEQIQHNIYYVAVCEWPTNDSRVLIYGYCHPRPGEEKRQCFITVTAVPSVEPCWECNQFKILHMHNGYYHDYPSLSDAPPRCLTHSYTVHTKYELAPPYPSFAPKIYLKLDGLVIINTGDSLIALNMELEENSIVPSFSLYSPRCARGTESTIDTESSSPSEIDRWSEPRPLEELDNLDSTLLGFGVQSPGSSGLHSARLHPVGICHVRDRHPSSGKENHMIGSPQPVTDVRHRYETPNKSNRSGDIYAFEGTPTPTKEDSDTGESENSSEKPPKSVRSTLSFSKFPPGANVSAESEEIYLFPGDLETSVELGRPETPKEIFDKPAHPVRMQPRDLNSSSNPRNPFSIEMLPFGKTLTISPGCGKIDQGDWSSTCSSCVSSPVILQNDSQCFTYSVRRYVEVHGVARPDSPTNEIEDDLSLAYQSILPVEVHGAQYSHMRLLTKKQLQPQVPCVVVKQLTLDIEHYIGETVRMTAEWGHRYLAFTDYDAQIVEVCPETSEVIALIYVLVRARPPKHAKVKHLKYFPKLYQTGFKLIWNLQTGSYNTLDVEELVEMNQAELRRKPKSWSPGRRISDQLQRQFRVPRSYFKDVNVMTNEAVVREQSLKMILDRHHYVVLLL